MASRKTRVPAASVKKASESALAAFDAQKAAVDALVQLCRWASAASDEMPVPFRPAALGFSARLRALLKAQYELCGPASEASRELTARAKASGDELLELRGHSDISAVEVTKLALSDVVTELLDHLSGFLPQGQDFPTIMPANYDRVRKFLMDVPIADFRKCVGYGRVQAELPIEKRKSNRDNPAESTTLNEANEMALQILAAHVAKSPDVKKTQRKLAADVAKKVRKKCSAALIAKTPSWKKYESEWKLSHPPAPRVTANAETLGAEDWELEKLIADQSADFEQSPLVGGRRRVRHRSRA